MSDKPEHKIRQEMFHKLEQIDDYMSDSNVIILIEPFEKILIKHIVDYFTKPLTEIIYPAKSYAVAIIYSKLLSVYFNESFYTMLNDPSLLFNNDKYFKPYNKAKNIYDDVLERISLNFNESLPQIIKTIEYFKKEFYLNKNIYFINK